MDIALGIFSILFLPGVFLHELSHLVIAKLLGVRTGRFSLLPRVLPDGKLQMGYVETSRADIFRSALIGTAPLITGSIAVAFLGIQQLGLAQMINNVNQGRWDYIWQEIITLPTHPDFFLWFYLAFVISSTMLPSDTDRLSWIPILIGLGIVLVASLLAGAGPWLVQHIVPPLNDALKSIAILFGIGFFLHLVLVIPVRVFREFIQKMTRRCI